MLVASCFLVKPSVCHICLVKPAAYITGCQCFPVGNRLENIFLKTVTGKNILLEIKGFLGNVHVTILLTRQQEPATNRTILTVGFNFNSRIVLNKISI